MKFETESAFSSWLSAQLKRAGFDVTRIESHDTGNGIPDAFVQGFGVDFWLELKNDKTKTIKQVIRDGIKIKWRPGQQAWAHRYSIFHHHNKYSLTICALKDGVIVIRHDNYYQDNYVSCENIIIMNDIRLLSVLSSRSLSGIGTYRQTIISVGDIFGFDYDPEVIFNDACDKCDLSGIGIDSLCEQTVINIISGNILEYFITNQKINF